MMGSASAIALLDRSTVIGEIKREVNKFLDIDEAAFLPLSHMTYLPFEGNPDTLFNRQICYLVLLSQDEEVERSPFTQKQERVFADAAQKVRTTSQWLYYGFRATSGLLCLNGTFAVAAVVGSLYNPTFAPALLTTSAICNCVVANLVQPTSFIATGTAPDQSSTAQDIRQNYTGESLDQYMKIAAKMIQLKIQKSEPFESLIRRIDVQKISALFAEILQDEEETRKISELLSNAVEYVLHGKTPSNNTLEQEVRITLLEHRATRRLIRKRHQNLPRIGPD